MKDGVYIAYFTGKAGAGSAVLFLNKGSIVGADVTGAAVTGVYSVNGSEVSFEVKFVFRTPSTLATSGQVVPAGTSFDAQFSVELAEVFSKTMRVETMFGPANVKLDFVQ